MCGIAGYWDWHRQLAGTDLHAAILGMTQCLYRRGPDGGGLFIDREAGLALGHRRLAIRDLSPLGAQPMVSPDGNFVLSYNGEIYNTAEIGGELAAKGIYPKGNSDTEILLLALMTFGIERILSKLLGMFAFALWDKKERRLFLARDRFGVKPLYWTADQGRRLLFASEPDALFSAPDWQPQIDFDSVALYLRFGYIPEPYSIWQRTHKLPAGHYLAVEQTGKNSIIQYWDGLAVANEGLNHSVDLRGAAEKDIVDELDALLTDAVFRRMVSDVPLGVFLSGGIDSTTVAALAQKCSQQPIRTFSIGFEEQYCNEAPYAAAIARHLRTEHTEMYVPVSKAWEIIPDLPQIYEEPFADASQIPTTLLCRLTRQYVTVALSGDGGDELFAGYDRYPACIKAAPEFPDSSFGRDLAFKAIKCLNAHQWDNLASFLPQTFRPRNLGSRLHNFADLNLHGSFAAYYQRYYLQYWWHPEIILKMGRPPAIMADNEALRGLGAFRLALMQFMDTKLYLAGDILTKVDRASMSCSLEARVPLLDQRVFGFAWRIPTAERIHTGKGKYLLRKVLERYVPACLWERPKMGFGIPLAQWLRGPLREWAENSLSIESLKASGIFRVKPLREAWVRHLCGASNWEYHLWFVLMLLTWFERRTPSRKNAGDLPAIYV